MTRTDVACQGRQIAALVSVQCAGLTHLEECSGQSVCADSLLRWMEGPFKGTPSASVGPGEIASIPRSKRMYFFFINNHLHYTRKRWFFSFGLRDKEGMTIRDLSSLLLRCQKRPQFMSHNSKKNLTRWKIRFPQTQPIILFLFLKWRDTRLLKDEKGGSPWLEGNSAGEKERVVGSNRSYFYLFIFWWTLKFWNSFWFTEKL